MNNDQRLIEQFINLHSAIAIPIIEELEVKEIALFIDDISLEKASAILSKIAPYKAGKVLEKLKLEKAITMVEMLPLHISESILRIADRSITDNVLAGLEKEKSKYLKRALSFAKDQVGAHLEPYVLTLSEHMTLDSVLRSIKESDAVVKPHLFVLNDENILLGYLELNEVLTNKSDKKIQSIMRNVPRTVFADMSVSELLEHWDDAFIDLPVLKVKGQFLGTVSRSSLRKANYDDKSTIDKSALKAGNALGDLYLIGLTSLLGSSDTNPRT